MHSVQLAVKRLYRIGDFTNNCGRAEFWIFIILSLFIEIFYIYITSNVLMGQKTNMLFIAATGIIWCLHFYLYLGYLSAHVARLKDAGFAKWVGRFYIVWNIFFSFLDEPVEHPAETTYTSGALILDVIIIILYCIPLLMPTAKSEEGPDGDWQGGVNQISKFVGRKINQGDGFRFLLRE
jgi:uncharacterized membrane protein YhaH (DUF805 family)